MAGVKSLKHLTNDKSGYNVGETVHDFMTAKTCVITEIVSSGSRRNYRVQFEDKSVQIRNRDDLDVIVSRRVPA